MITRTIGVAFIEGDTVESRQEIIEELSRKRLQIFGQYVQLIREMDNKHDKNAVAVIGPGQRKLGYINREVAAEIAPLMDKGARAGAFIRQFLVDDNNQFYGIDIVLGVEELNEIRKEE